MVKKIGGKGRNVGKGGKPSLNGVTLFKREYWSDEMRKGKHKTIQDADKEVREAWNKLSTAEKSKYAQKAKEDRDRMGCVSSIKEGEVRTRSSLKQFVQFAHFVRSDARLRAKAKNIGFEKLLDVTCTQIPHALCGQLVKAIDPATSSICIRNLRRQIVEKDVHDLLGLPNGGSEIIEKANTTSEQFVKLKVKLGRKRFSDIKEMIISGQEEDMFEALMVLYMLGTLLSPPKNGGVSDRLLKIISADNTSLGCYDWCQFVLNDLMTEVTEYKNAGVRSKCIGGCIYFLMILFFQMFPLLPEEPPLPKHAVKFWTDAKVKEVVKREYESDQGILFRYVPPILDDIRSNSNPKCDARKRDIDYTLQLPKVTIFKEEMTRQMYCTIMGKVAQTVASELLNMEKKFEQHIKRDTHKKGNIVGDDKESDTHVEAQDVGQQRGDSEDKRQGTEEHASYSQTQDHIHGHQDTDIGLEDRVPTSHVQLEVHSHEVNDESLNDRVPLRRSQRIIRPAIHSPFLSEIGKTGRPTEKERLYDYCTRRTNPLVGQHIYVEIRNFFLRKSELYCLNRRGWISECVVSLIANVLVDDQKESAGGRVTRHIFQPIFMDRMLGDLNNWNIDNHAKFIEPDKVGYNISDCDYVFAPVVRDQHWCCYVFVKKEMTLYLLDSLLPNYNSPGGANALLVKREKGHKVSKHFCDLLAYLNHDLYGHKPEFSFRFGLVEQQSNGWDCGMYVISWLQMWENIRKPEWNGFTMPNEDMDQKRVDVVWWLVTHHWSHHLQWHKQEGIVDYQHQVLKQITWSHGTGH